MANFSLKFTKIEMDLLFFSVQYGEKKVDLYFSEVFDPLIFLKSWLEAISVGTMQTSFFYDPEGDEIIFDFSTYEDIDSDVGIFTIKYLDIKLDDGLILKAKVKRKTLVKSFYNAYFSFVNSRKFIQNRSKNFYLYESEKFKSEIIEKYLNENKK